VQPGLALRSQRPERGVCRRQRRARRQRELRGVVTRIANVHASDLAHIVEQDREYVAAELNAFLTAWLDSLRCPVINRPSASSLLGPALSHERWLALARGRLRLAMSRHRVPVDEHPYAPVFVTVIGDRWFATRRRSASSLAARTWRRCRPHDGTVHRCRRGRGVRGARI